MKKDIPHISFASESNDNYGFDIVPIERIKKNRVQRNHNSELPHQLKFYNLIYFTEGSGKHFIDFNWYPVKKNTLVYIAKEQLNAFDFSQNLGGYCIVFTEKYFVSCFSNLAEDFVFRLFNPQLFSPILNIPDRSDFHNYFNLLNQEFKQPSLFNHKVILDSLFTILISKAENIKQFEQHSFSDSSKVLIFQQFTSLISKSYNYNRNANFYANKLCITYKHLNIVCKELVHKTAKNVIDDFIILQAKRKLINSAVKSNELGYSLGFNDPTNFIKYFKKNTGLTPKSFLKSVKNN